MQIPGIGGLHRNEQDYWHAYELPAGLGILARLGLDPSLDGRSWLGLLVSLALLGGAGWWAWRRETALRKRDEPTILLSLSMWRAVAVATLLTFGLVWIVDHEMIVFPTRWQPLALQTGVWTGTLWLTLGVARNRPRHVYLGLWLCGVGALLPAIDGPTARMWISAAAIGGGIALSGWLAGRKR